MVQKAGWPCTYADGPQHLMQTAILVDWRPRERSDNGTPHAVHAPRSASLELA